MLSDQIYIIEKWSTVTILISMSFELSLFVTIDFPILTNFLK